MATKAPKTLDVISQIRTATKNPIALMFGIMLGGFVPFAIYHIAHTQVANTALQVALWTLAIGGLLYSAKTVWQWGAMAFECRWKATGFVILLEGVMMLSPLQWLAITALCYLVAINAIATGCQLALRHMAATKPRSSTKTKTVTAKTSKKAQEGLRRVV